MVSIFGVRHEGPCWPGILYATVYVSLMHHIVESPLLAGLLVRKQVFHGICYVSCTSLVLQVRIKEDQLHTQNYIVVDALFQFPA